MTILRVEGMKCGHCQAIVGKIFEELGATQVEIDLNTGAVSFAGEIDREALAGAIAAKGFILAA